MKPLILLAFLLSACTPPIARVEEPIQTLQIVVRTTPVPVYAQPQATPTPVPLPTRKPLGSSLDRPAYNERRGVAKPPVIFRVKTY